MRDFCAHCVLGTMPKAILCCDQELADIFALRRAKFFPETSGRSLEEIDAIFAESKSIFDTVGVARRMPRSHLAELVTEDKDGRAEYLEDLDKKSLE
jgi:hypothetical protein